MLLARRSALDALSVTTLTALTACGRDTGAADPSASSDLVEEIHGTGATSRFDVQGAWTNTFMGANLRTTVDYADSGSGARHTELVEGIVNFAGTDTPMTADKASRIGGVVKLPLYISPVAMAYNLSSSTSESHVDTADEVLAKVLSGAIIRWNDPALATLSPGTAPPGLRITVVGRSDDSGTTKALTTCLVTVTPKTWPHGPEETWPLRGGQSGSGTAGMIQTVSATTGTIGYANASKVSATLGTVAVGPDGAYMPVSAKAAAAALDAATLGSEADETRLLYQPSHDAEGVYPTVLVSYLAARLCYGDARIAAIVKAYLRFAASIRRQDASTKAAGCAPIIRQIHEKIDAAIGKIAA